MAPSPVLGVVATGSWRPREMALLVKSLIQVGHKGPLVVVDGSGEAVIWEAACQVAGFDELDARGLFVQSTYLGRRRHNAGARMAIDAGATHLLFPNDYQTILRLPSFLDTGLVPPTTPSIGVGRLQGRERSKLMLTPPIHKENAVTASSPWRSRRRAWGSALEALLLITADMFTDYGGWSERIVPGDPASIAYAGDGLELVARCMAAGGTIYPLPSLILGGGHRAPNPDAARWKFTHYGRGTIQMGRHLGFSEWYLGLQVARAQLRAMGIGLPESASLSGSREEWRHRAAGMRSEWLWKERGD